MKQLDTLFKNNASRGMISIYTRGCIMKRTYKDRVDIINELGKKFHDLTVISFAGKGKYRGAMWECICVCGKKCIVPGGHLRANMRKSCGCRSQSRIEETGVNILFSGYRSKASKRKLDFNLDLKSFEKLIKGKCNYCGIDRSQMLRRQKAKTLQILYNGIDRIDPTLGYSLENCVSCCKYCNQSKSNLSLDEWRDHLNRIFNKMGIAK